MNKNGKRNIEKIPHINKTVLTQLWITAICWYLHFASEIEHLQKQKPVEYPKIRKNQQNDVRDFLIS